MKEVLIVDDEAAMRAALEANFARHGWRVRSAAGVAEALTAFRVSSSRLVITDMRMADGDGLQVMEGVRKCLPETPVILLTAYGSVPDAVQAMRGGACDYLEKPISFEELEARAEQFAGSGVGKPLGSATADVVGESLSATAVAEYFSAQGKHVLLVVDSLTRFAMAQREIGLAAGEPPTAKGYTPSVFTLLARLIERAGNFGRGSITAFYTVLMEGDDQQDPLVDAVRALLDGHVLLDRKLNARGHYPPISVLDSLSRLMGAVCTAAHVEKARRLRQLLASYAANEDLVRIGAYQKGGDATLDQALAALPAITRFLQQGKTERAPIEETLAALQALPG
jgi:DNA-binding response OmpR family regulator